MTEQELALIEARWAAPEKCDVRRVMGYERRAVLALVAEVRRLRQIMQGWHDLAKLNGTGYAHIYRTSFEMALGEAQETER